MVPEKSKGDEAGMQSTEGSGMARGKEERGVKKVSTAKEEKAAVKGGRKIQEVWPG
jgi:hypothetical protein